MAKASALNFLDTIPTNQVMKSVLALPISSIEPDPEQPRTDFVATDGVIPDQVQESLNNLADSIKEQGVLQPILVKEMAEGRYRIIMGERRWRAAKLAGLTDIPAIVENMEGEQYDLAQLAENMQRENLSDYDVAKYLQRIMDKHPKLKKKNLAAMLNRPNSYISRMLALINPEYSHLVDSGLITYASVLEKFLALPKESQDKLVEQAKESGNAINAGAIDAERKNLKGKTAASPQVSSSDPEDEAFGPKVPASLADAVSEVLGVAEPLSTEPIHDFGSPDFTPNIDKSVSVPVAAEAVAVREVKLMYSQLEKLIAAIKPEGQTQVKLQLQTAVIRQMIEALGGNAPEQDEYLVNALLAKL